MKQDALEFYRQVDAGTPRREALQIAGFRCKNRIAGNQKAYTLLKYRARIVASLTPAPLPEDPDASERLKLATDPAFREAWLAQTAPKPPKFAPMALPQADSSFSTPESDPTPPPIPPPAPYFTARPAPALSPAEIQLSTAVGDPFGRNYGLTGDFSDVAGSWSAATGVITEADRGALLSRIRNREDSNGF